ncbi:UNVERIFIED_CONTAM: hypothetical protein RMT77_006431 [Armadillidium vulgare]
MKEDRYSSFPKEKKSSSFNMSWKRSAHKVTASKSSTFALRPAVAKRNNPVGDSTAVYCKICDGKHYLSS